VLVIANQLPPKFSNYVVGQAPLWKGPAFPENIKFEWKWLFVTNVLGFYSEELIMTINDMTALALNMSNSSHL
jgi:hypothetical protein